MLSTETLQAATGRPPFPAAAIHDQKFDDSDVGVGHPERRHGMGHEKPLSIVGTPAERQLWATYAFVAVNLASGFFVSWFSFLSWMRKVWWFKRTGGLVPVPSPPSIRHQAASIVVALPFCTWCTAVYFLGKWLRPEMWPAFQWISTELYILGFVLIMFAPLPLALALILSTNRHVQSRIQQEWKNVVNQEWTLASAPERVAKAIVIAWSFGPASAAMLFIGGGVNLITWVATIPFLIPSAVLVWVVIQCVTFTTLALSASP